LGAVTAAQIQQETGSERGKAAEDTPRDGAGKEAGSAARSTADDAPVAKSAVLRGDGLSAGDRKADAIRAATDKPRPAKAAAADVIASATQSATVTKPALTKRRKRRVKAPLAQWTPFNGSYPDLTIARPKRRTLTVNINKKNLQRVYLDASRFQENNPAKVDPPLEASRGPECPTFEYGYEGFPGIASCWRNPIEDVLLSPASLPANCANATDGGCMQEADKQPHERWSAQVLLLHNVYVNVAGQVFNRTHLFDHNGCAADAPFNYKLGETSLSTFPTLISLVDWFGWSARAYILDLVPSIVTLDTVLPLLKGVPVALGLRDRHLKNQMEQATGLGHWELVGVRLERMNPQILKEGDLFFAERLILPLKQRCGRPSRALWSYLRHRNLLPKPGLPIYRHEFKPTYRKRKGEDLSAGSDWIVIVAMRDEWKPLVQTLHVQQQLLKWLPAERVVTYRDGSLSFVKRKELFNKARLLVAAHDNVLADMVFMPSGGAVLEIRPQEEPDPTFHHLADACHLDYYLLFSDGRKADGKKGGKPKVKDPKVVHKLLERIARRIRKTKCRMV
ncbi:hypothetical protein CLOM_g6883, partial [Closterium sp. NIES-68]